MPVKFSVLCFAVLSSLFGLSALPAQESSLPLGAGVAPYLSVPVGRDASVFKLGGGSDLFARWHFSGLPLATGVVVDYAWVPSSDPLTSLSIVGLGGQVAWSWPLTKVLAVSTEASIGGFFARLNDSSGTSGVNSWFQGGAGLEFLVTDSWIVAGQADVRSRTGLMNDARFSLLARYQPPRAGVPIIDFRMPPGYSPLLKEKRGLKLTAYQAEPIFPVFLKYYDTHDLARVILHNYEGASAERISLNLEFKGYMDGPRDLIVPVTMSPGEDSVVDLQALFNERLLTVAETTKLSANLTLNYTQGGVEYHESYSPSLVVQFRNGMTWDDDRHVAAFISSHDPATFGYGRGVLASTRDSLIPGLNPEIQTAMAFHTALRQSGLVYVKDPTSAFNNQNMAAVDSLQFPQETLTSRSGDCDDLTILWCSLMESVGIETAAITVPGHILMAFALSATPEQALALWGSADDFLIRDGKVWVPFETTMIRDHFLDAWQSAAHQIISQKADVKFLPIHDAWNTFPPVVVSGTTQAPAVPGTAKLNAEFKTAVGAYVEDQLRPRADQIQADLKAAPASQGPKFENKLGILYAKYGQYPQATEIFKKLALKNYRPAQVNLGNTFLLTDQPKAAIEPFLNVLKTQPDDKVALAGLALAYQGSGDEVHWKASMERLAKIDQNQAGQLEALKPGADGNGNRADDVSQKQGLLTWKE